MANPTWRGAQREYQRLRSAVLRNCTCEVPPVDDPNPSPKCPACRMLTDQDALNHLEFVALRRQEIWDGEFEPPRIRPCRLCGQFHMSGT